MGDIPAQEQLTAIQKLLKCHTLQDLLGTARPLVGHPLLVTDLTHRVLASTDEPALADARWAAILQQGSAPLTQTERQAAHQVYRASAAEQRPMLDRSPSRGMILRMTLTRGEASVGYLNAPWDGPEPTAEALDLFDLLGRLCALQMPHTANYAEHPTSLFEAFVSDLLEGRMREKALILERLRHFRWSLSLPVRVLSLRRDSEEKTNVSLVQESLQMDTLLKGLTARFPKAVSFLYGSGLKMIIPAYPNAEEEAKCSGQLRAFLEEAGLVCGISSALEDVTQFHEYHAQAETALRLGALLEPERRLFYYDMLAIYHSLELCAKELDLFSFCHPATLILANYDREHNTNLLQTLNVYLSCHCNIAESAGCMFIHRNTMTYRMTKINELVQLDYDNTEVFFHLMYSFHVLRYYSATVMLDLQQQRQRFPNPKNKKLL